MTRDEAIIAAIKSKEKWGGGSSEAWLVNALEALGVLKIDEPKSISVDDEIAAAIWADHRLSRTSPAYVLETIRGAGFKIVKA